MDSAGKRETRPPDRLIDSLFQPNKINMPLTTNTTTSNPTSTTSTTPTTSMMTMVHTTSVGTMSVSKPKPSAAEPLKTEPSVQSLLQQMMAKMSVCSQIITKITHISQNQIKDIGGKAELACTVSNPLNYYVLWLKLDSKKSNEPLLLSFGNTLNIKDSRLSIRQESIMDEMRYTLQINDLQEIDNDIYRCTMEISLHNIISAEVELKVRGPPMIHDNSTSSIAVVEGQQVTPE